MAHHTSSAGSAKDFVPVLSLPGASNIQKPFSFAQAAVNGAQSTSQKHNTAGSVPANQVKQTLKLKRWPANKDPKVLLSYLELEIKNKVNLTLFQEISAAHSKDEKRLIIMRGLPGSGKSILSVLFSGVTEHGTIISADDYFLDRRGIYKFNPQDLGKAHEACQRQCKKAMSGAQNPIIIDNTNTKIWEMIPYVEMALTFQYRIHVVEPTTPWKNSARILAQKNDHGVPFEKIKTMLDRYDKDVTPEKLVSIVKSKQKKQDVGLDAALEKLSLS